jgi:hypothetical protein
MEAEDEDGVVAGEIADVQGDSGEREQERSKYISRNKGKEVEEHSDDAKSGDSRSSMDSGDQEFEEAALLRPATS